MSRNNLWKGIFVVLLVAWSLYELYPPQGRDLAQVFRERAQIPPGDTTFSNIVVQLQALQKDRPGQTYSNILDAIGTNDITRYFPFTDAKDQLHPTIYVLNRLQREAAGRIKLGLDLQGGTAVLVEMDTNYLVNVETQTQTNAQGQVVQVEVTNRVEETQEALSQAVEVLRKRVDVLGVAEPVLQPVGSDRILVQLPGLSEASRETAVATIKRAAFLEFRLVHPDSDNLIKEHLIPPGYELLRRKEKLRSGTERLEEVLVKKKADLSGSIIKNAQVVRGSLGEPQISFTLNSQGTEKFGQITRDNVGRRLAIILDGVLYSAPVINSPIETGRGEITGQFDLPEAFELANVLQNPLKAPLKVISYNDVDPTLGRESIRSGIRASLIGVIAVVGFMLIYYMRAGVVANAALMLNIIILLGVMCAIGTTLTLPGIAGVVLTIGMAVDANVLIYERIREELAAGKSMGGALVAGYNKAFGTIFDSNLTTLISSVILWYMGTGSVKGFGVTLTIGVTVSMFTALVVTRLIFDWLLAKNWLKNLRMLHLIRGANIDFMRWAVPAFIASWTLILVGNGYGLFVRGHNLLGVDFAGGIEQIYRYSTPAGASKDTVREDVANALAPLNLGEITPAIQQEMATGNRTLRLVLPYKEGVSDQVARTLQEKLPQYHLSAPSVNSVGPTVGAEIMRTAILASLLAMFGILVYVAFRYEFSFAVGAVIGLVHDIFMTLGCYYLAGRQLNATTVAAVLTIIGFSINDTIVIFDRIREDLKLGIRGTFREVMNQALNQTLSRTIITSGTVFLATLALFIFGGGPINDFSLCFLVGIVTGTYSSIYISSALVLWWHKGQRPAIGSQVAMQGAAAAPAPSKA